MAALYLCELAEIIALFDSWAEHTVTTLGYIVIMRFMATIS